MAAVTKTSKKSSKAKAPTKNNSPIKGLKLTQAQFQAYTSAYTAAARAARTRIALHASATRFRAYRLSAAYSTLAKYRAVNKSVQRSAVAAYAVRQSYLQSREGHQSAGLKARVAADYHRSVTLLGRQQYARSGERKYASVAVMRTVTQGQAVDHEKKFFKDTGKIVKRATGPRKKSKFPLSSAQQASVQAAGVKAGLAAAHKVPASRKAAAPGMTRSRSQWQGKPSKPNCVPVAVTNAMIYHTGYRPRGLVSRWVFSRRLERACGPEPTIPQALGILSALLQDGDHPVRLRDFDRVPAALGQVGGHVIGYRSAYGPHAALSLPGHRIVTWGAEAPYDGITEEAYSLEWSAADG